MAVQNTFDCDLCEQTKVKDGVTLVYENDLSGDHRAPKHRLKKVLDHLAVVHDAPKSQHICIDCTTKIKSPVSK
ncbi:MAG: hypothetical protein R3250_10815 [Melioribacteraceae bacterium]|nr:hypothetical protein [Melioribacteraceae bacterium]